MTVDANVRRESQQAFAAATVRRMFSEALFDSIVQAGHLFEVKHPAGQNMVTIRTTVREMISDKTEPLDSKKKPPTAMMKPKMDPMAGAYDLERGIEVDFKDVLKKRGEGIEIDAMKRMSDEEIEANEMMERPDGPKSKYRMRIVETTIDDNPKFISSMRMATPAPVGHFLRVFGQSDRSSLNEHRESSPSMRQALMMFNGKLTNEAARVGALEPMYPLLSGKTPDLAKAIRLAYREALTREPNAREEAEAREIIKGGATTLDGIADLRWALFNCHEFRYLP
jgi:hypothetical protein